MAINRRCSAGKVEKQGEGHGGEKCDLAGGYKDQFCNQTVSGSTKSFHVYAVSVFSKSTPKGNLSFATSC